MTNHPKGQRHAGVMGLPYVWRGYPFKAPKIETEADDEQGRKATLTAGQERDDDRFVCQSHTQIPDIVSNHSQWPTMITNYPKYVTEMI